MSLNHEKQYNMEIREWLSKVFSFAAKIDKASLRSRPCPVCGSATISPYAGNGCLDYARCQSCSLIFMNPALPADKLNNGFLGDDEIVMDYFKMISRYKSAVPPRPDPLTDNKLRDIYSLRPSGRLLDVGCSVGDFLHKAKHFYEVEGLEVNPHTSAEAAKYFTVHRGFLGELKLPKVYDIVTLHQILYGVPDPVGLLKDIYGVLKEDGLLYVNTPNADSYAMKLYGGKCNHLYGYTAQNVFNRASLARLAEKTGFKIISYRTEWLDIYTPDLMVYLSEPAAFIHKRNCQVPDYEAKIKAEDELNARLYPDLGNNGNYLVAVLAKK
jgi:SAM-dependent methyltransferase